MQTYTIDEETFNILEKTETPEGHILYSLHPVGNDEYVSCPNCYSLEFVKNGPYIRKVRDTSEHDRLVGLLVHGSRYQCKNCGMNFVTQLSSVRDASNMTNRLRDYICRESLAKPFTVVSEETGLSVSTIKRAFHDHVQHLDSERELIAPTILGIDENHLLKKNRAVFTDIENGLLLDMLSDRNKPSVVSWLKGLPQKERIRVVTMDMWTGYKNAVHEVLPGVPVVIDKFHVISAVIKALDDIRKDLQKKHPEQKYLFQKRRLLQINREDLSYEQQVSLRELFETYPELEKPYSLKEDFRDIYRCKKKWDAMVRYRKWIDQAEPYPPYAKVIRTIHNWHDEIFNYFEYRYTNATTEMLNRVINEINERAHGYSFEVLRAKAIYHKKAVRKAKYRFISAGSRMSPGAIGMMKPFDFGRKELIHGEGVSLEALMEDL